jgi:hypothetical protein
MASEIRRHMMTATGDEASSWKRFVTRLVHAHKAGQPLEPLIEAGYSQVLFHRRVGRLGPPETQGEWTEAVIFHSPDEIRQRATRDR